MAGFGMSAGTNIALSLCYRLKRYGFRPSGCVVEACFTDPRPIWPTSTITAGGNWNAELMWRSSVEYLGVNNVPCFDDPEMYPIYATPEDAVGLCPTFLHPDSEEQGASAVRAYCDTLSQAGVYHECHVWGGTAHAILRFSAFAGDAALIRGSDEGVEKNDAADSYAQRFLSIVDGNIRDCWKYDLRRAFTVEKVSE